MKLTDSDFAHLTRYKPDGLPKVDNLAEADGVFFECPVDGHAILVWFADRPAVPPDLRPLYRWRASGTSLANLTLDPSVNLEGHSPCNWHGWVKNGEAK